MKQILFAMFSLMATAVATAAGVPTFAGQVKAEEFHVRGGIGHVMEKIRAGQDVKIAYFGGSITEMDGWRRLSREWLQAQYPAAKFSEIAAAIGGTGSSLGVYRFRQDVLAKNPDLIFVEFATNDSNDAVENIWRNFDGFIRQAWQANPEIDIVFVYTITQAMEADYKKRLCNRAASAMEQLSDYYGIPSVGFGPRVIADVMSGKLVWTLGEFATAVPAETPDRDNAIMAEMAAQGKVLFSKDGVHPLLSGHAYYLESLKAAWPELVKPEPVDHAEKLAVAFYDATMEAAKMVSIAPEMMSGTWRQLAANEKNGNFGPRFGAAPWFTETPGAKLHFYIRGRGCMIYDLVGPDCGQLWVTVDGVKKATPVPRFDHYCTYYRVGTLGVFSGAEGVHEIEIELDAKQPDRSGVKVQGVTDEELKGEKYNGTTWYAGRLMLIGDAISEEEAHPPEVVDTDPSAWFNANVEAYAKWPKDATKTIRGGWSTTADALADVADVSETGVLDISTGSDTLSFTAEKTVTLGVDAKSVSIESTVAFGAYPVDQLPTVNPAWKGSIILVNEGETLAYYGLRQLGAANVWTRLVGTKTSQEGKSVYLALTFTRAGGRLAVSYAVDGDVLTADGAEKLPVVGDLVFTGIDCGGSAQMQGLIAHTVAPQGFMIRICKL